MLRTIYHLICFLFMGNLTLVIAQNLNDPSTLTIDRIYESNEFTQDYERTIQWIEDGNAYVTIEKSPENSELDELIRYESATQKSSPFVSVDVLKSKKELRSIESFSLSPDESKVLIFNNSSSVWRSNTKGDYWVVDRETKELKQLGASLAPSSLMFAKFSSDNKYVFYVYHFNLYKEDFKSGRITQLTFDGTGAIINGTFDWAYEEEFGKRDGFNISPKATSIAYWQLDASDIGTFYMINNTDSIYSKPIPLQYPKVGQDPSSARIGILDLKKEKTRWIRLPGDPKQHYIPGIQWVHDDLLLIQQMNRLQNQLIVWKFIPSSEKLDVVYEEKENTWVDLKYPDISADGWGNNDLPIVDGGKAFLRMTETSTWRHIYKITIATRERKLITPFDFDIASTRTITQTGLYFIASPQNSTQRYLYLTDVSGNGKLKRITPSIFEGVNTYDVAPNGKYAIHIHQSAKKVRTVRFISLPDHKTLNVLVDNKNYARKIEKLKLPEIEFTKVLTEEGIEIDVRVVYPVNFDKNQKYPVLFHVYGEPWGQVATDTQIGLWNIMMAQKGYFIIDMDNRGTPCLKGSAWRKSIYRKVGVMNTRDQALAARELLKLDYLDTDRVAVWGWSGGGSMTLNLMFQYPEIYKTGVAVAAVSDQLIYDNIYQERYMGLPQENKEDFVKGSPITYAKNLEGKLLIVHGTGDDNVHYQSAELLINELVKHNKQFQFMPYPNRTHGIRQGENTRRHLYSLISNFIDTHTNKKDE